jgi:phosphate/phosphite/phosphonate ABC transporter binding protein
VAIVLLGAFGGLGYRLLLGVRPKGPPLLFAFPRTYPTEVWQQELRPLISHLEHRLDRRVEAVIPQDYRAATLDLLEGRVHFAMMPALQLVLAQHRKAGVRMLASASFEGARTYQSYLITRVESGIVRVEDLRGKSFCYVDPGSASGYLVPRHFLRSQGLDPDRFFRSVHFSNDHLTLLQDLLDGRCEAGSVYSGAMISAPGHGIASSRLRILAVAGQIPYDVVCAAPDLPEPLARRVQQVLLALDMKRDLKRRIVGPSVRIGGFLPYHDDEFALIRKLARKEGLLDGGQ